MKRRIADDAQLVLAQRDSALKYFAADNETVDSLRRLFAHLEDLRSRFPESDADIHAIISWRNKTSSDIDGFVVSFRRALEMELSRLRRVVELESDKEALNGLSNEIHTIGFNTKSLSLLQNLSNVPVSAETRAGISRFCTCLTVFTGTKSIVKGCQRLQILSVMDGSASDVSIGMFGEYKEKCEKLWNDKEEPEITCDELKRQNGALEDVIQQLNVYVGQELDEMKKRVDMAEVMMRGFQEESRLFRVRNGIAEGEKIEGKGQELAELDVMCKHLEEKAAEIGRREKSEEKSAPVIQKVLAERTKDLKKPAIEELVRAEYEVSNVHAPKPMLLMSILKMLVKIGELERRYNAEDVKEMKQKLVDCQTLLLTRLDGGEIEQIAEVIMNVKSEMAEWEVAMRRRKMEPTYMTHKVVISLAETEK